MVEGWNSRNDSIGSNISSAILFIYNEKYGAEEGIQNGAFWKSSTKNTIM